MNIKWAVLLVVATGAALWFSATCAVDLWGYFRLRAHAPAHIERWEVEESSSKFFVVGHYTFSVAGKTYQGNARVHPPFLNRLTAEEEAGTWHKYQWRCWYDPHKPTFSSLQKLFPYKKTVYALMTVGLTLYFYLLPRQAFSRAIFKRTS